nr:MbtH family NRPS accessory protein [Burkholderia ambifaria]
METRETWKSTRRKTPPFSTVVVNHEEQYAIWPDE